jgi:hypothetical protein
MRGEADGLSTGMFLCAIAGNGLGATGILVRVATPTELLQQLPWLIGMLGTISMDFFIMWQVKQSKQRQSEQVACPARAPDSEPGSPNAPLLQAV